MSRGLGDTSAGWKLRQKLVAEVGTCWRADGPPFVAAAAAAAEPRRKTAVAVAAGQIAVSSRRHSRCWSPRDPRRGSYPPFGH